MSDSSPTTEAYSPPDSASTLVRVLDDYLAAVQKGTPPNREAFLAEHPELADQLKSCLAAIDFIHRNEESKDSTPANLGDFRIIRELGRGGMGVVYEAEQLSLKRRVALKVLRFGAATDAEAMNRFRREAETVAKLHHTNIVPVFAVGSEQGVHYYAMQLIEGFGLDKASTYQHVGFDDVARWGTQAADALAHAHARGVIHRDIKPSNLLLDKEGTVWLTDFGLARRSEEVALTMTGVLMGTPRYMSPEQAAATKQPVNERSDIYSLGASLYELATGKPVHTGDTPQILIAQILLDEPVPPRQHVPNMPRDLETVLLKCLAKEPAHRYGSAKELADDLRRFNDGEPIKARRPSARERLGRWAKKHRGSLSAGIIAASLAVLSTVGGLLFYQQQSESRLGRLLLNTHGPHLTAEVLDDNNKNVTTPFTVPALDSVAIPEGEYRVRLSRPGALSESFRVTIPRQRTLDYQVRIGARQPWPAFEIGREDPFAFLQLEDKPELVILECNRGVRRVRHGGEVVWEILWGNSQQGNGAGYPGAEAYGLKPFEINIFFGSPTIVEPAIDINGDGVRDIVFSGKFGAVALSGSNGFKLWSHRWTPMGIRDSIDEPAFPTTGTSTTAIGKSFLREVNDDGIPDLISLIYSSGEVFVDRSAGSNKEVRTKAGAWMQCISGKTGQSLWQAQIPYAWSKDGPRLMQPQLIKTSAGERLIIPDDTKLKVLELKHHLIKPVPPEFEYVNQTIELGSLPVKFEVDRISYPQSLPAADVLPVDANNDGLIESLVVVRGNRLFVIDAASGTLATPGKVLGFTTLCKPEWVAGKPPRLLLTRQVDDEHLEFVTMNWPDLSEAWRQTVRADWPPGRGKSGRRSDWEPRPEWPVVQRQSILLPIRPERTRPKPVEKPEVVNLDFSEKSTHWGGVMYIDSATGQERWRRYLYDNTSPGQVDRFSFGPDINGDGIADVFVASFGQGSRAVGHPYGNFTHRYVYVTALSGANGQTLWWWRERQRNDEARLEPLRWWQNGPDGLPLLVVSYNSTVTFDATRGPSTTWLLEATTGRLAHTLPDIGQPQFVEMDGDGSIDMYAIVSAPQGHRSNPVRTLFTLRSIPGLVWGRLGQWTPTQDLDGDGIPDAVGEVGNNTSVAISGQTGKEIWRSPYTATFLNPPLPSGDLDGDGVPDLIGNSAMSRTCLSGRTGKLLSPDPNKDRTFMQDGIGLSYYTGFPETTVVNLYGTARSTLLYVYGLQKNLSSMNSPEVAKYELRMTAIDGHSQNKLWSAILADASHDNSQFAIQIVGTSDLDGDGVHDIVLLIGDEANWKVTAVRGADGKALWNRPLSVSRKLSSNLYRNDRWPRVVIDPGAKPDESGVFTLERECEVLPGHPEDSSSDLRLGPSRYRLQGLKGRDGQPVWSWTGLELPAFKTRLNHVPGIPWNERMVLANLKNFGPCLCVAAIISNNETRQARNHFFVFNTHGNLREESSEETIESYSDGLSIGQLQAVDLDGDGSDELLRVSWRKLDGKLASRLLTATRNGFNRAKMLWETGVDREDPIARFLPGCDRQKPFLLLHDRQLHLDAVDAWTGRKIGHYPMVSGSQLPPAGAATPLIFSKVGDSTTCQTLPGVGPIVHKATMLPNLKDPRMAMPLPWAGWDQLVFYLTSAVYSLVLLVGPMWFLIRAIRSRSWLWGLAFLAAAAFAVYAVVAGWISSVLSLDVILNILPVLSTSPGMILTWPLGKLVTLDLRVARTIQGLATIVFAVTMLKFLFSRQWRRALMLVCVVIIGAMITACVMLHFDDTRFDPQQYYSWYLWWVILLHGCDAAGVVIIAYWIGKQVWRLVCWRPRRLVSASATA